MTCCIALALAIGFLRSAWYFVRGGAPTSPAFAPVARRAAPGVVAPERPDAVLDPGASDGRGLRLAWVLRGAAIGIAAYAIGVFVLVELGIAVVLAEPATWFARTLGSALVAAIALVVADRLVAHESTSGENGAGLGFALVGAGVVWLELAVVDLELLGLYQLGACVCCGWKAPTFVASGLAAAAIAAWIARASAQPSLGRVLR